MALPPRADIQRAFLEPTVHVIRRLEIYEQDGTTPWRKDLWPELLVGGSVSLDYDRDERRSFDAEFDNSYGDLDPEAGGFWYDKRIKLYYGLHLNQSSRSTRVAVVEENLSPGQAFALKEHLAANGLTEVHYLPSAINYSQVENYDVLVAISATSLTKVAFLTECYNKGKGIVTFSMNQTAASLPGIVGNAGAGTVIAGSERAYAPLAVASDLSVGWSEWSVDARSDNLVTLGGQGFESLAIGTPPGGSAGATIMQISDAPTGSSKVYNAPSNGGYVTSPALVGTTVTPGDVYYFEVDVRKTTSGTVGSVAFVRRTTDNSSLANPLYNQHNLNLSAMTQGVWQKLSGTVTIPSGKTWLSPYLQVNNNVPSGQVIQWDNAIVRKVSQSEYYRKILAPAAGAITVADMEDDQGESIGVISREDSDDRRWVHTVMCDFTEEVLGSTYEEFGKFATRAVAWASAYEALDSWEIQLGEFMMDSIATGDSYTTVTVQGRDLTKLCMNSKFAASTTFTKDTAIESIVKTVATNSGITKMKLPITKKVLDKDTTWERDVARWEVIRDVCNANNYEVFFDNEGYLVMREFRDPLLSTATLELSVGPGGNLVSRGARTSDTRLFNHIVVVGESSDSETPPVYAEAINNVEASPTSVQEIGDRVSVTTSSLVTTIGKAQELADSLLAVSALEEFELPFTATLLPWIEVGDIILMAETDSRYWGPDRFLLTSLSFPLDLTPMTGTGKRVEKVVTE